MYPWWLLQLHASQANLKRTVSYMAEAVEGNQQVVALVLDLLQAAEEDQGPVTAAGETETGTVEVGTETGIEVVETGGIAPGTAVVVTDFSCFSSINLINLFAEELFYLSHRL